MMNTINITQTTVGQVLDHVPDQVGNKIKLKDESYRNCIRHIGNIPFHVEVPSQVVMPKIDFTVLSNDNITVLNGEGKAINIKDHMLTGIQSHAKVKVNSVPEVSKIKEISEPVATLEVEENKITDFPTNEPFIDSTLSVNDRFDEISNARQLVQDAMTRANQAEQEAKESEETLNKLSIEDAEAQKKLEEAEVRKNTMEEKITEAINSQASILEETRKKYENLITEANNRRNQSMTKIEDVRNRIQSTNERLSKVENEIASKQQILDALSQFETSDNILSFPSSNKEENLESSMGRRVA